MNVKHRNIKILEKLNRLIKYVDTKQLWLLGIVVAAVNFLPYFILWKGSVFPYHDQLDETILSYVLNGRHLWEKIRTFPEMMCGINVSGMQPSALLFVPLYHYFPAFTAFLIQYFIIFSGSFLGMYFCVNEIVESSILSFVAASCFSMLPLPPVYGLSFGCVPIVLFCFIRLYKKKSLFLCFSLLLFSGLTSHLVLIGYVLLGIWFLVLVFFSLKKRGNRWLWLGFLWLMAIYVLVNYGLFLELILGNGNYVSHREEIVTYATPFWNTVKDVFLNSSQHAESHHRHLILPIISMLIIYGGFVIVKKRKPGLDYISALSGFFVLLFIALFYGICKWQPVVTFKNNAHGFLHYFQMERFYWLYPACWYLEFCLCFSLFWKYSPKNAGRVQFIGMPVVKLIVLFFLLFPTLQEIKVNSYLYLNVNQINNGSGITGYISWESYYAEDLMKQIEETIGRDMNTYRIAHLGISPAPALMHGFYTVDGYSNNYSLEYKHRFRDVIAKELEKNNATRLYFDEWGSRCYLFNGSTGTAWMLGKAKEIIYEKLDFNMDALKNLGCEYLFSCGKIMNEEELKLKCLGYYTSDDSYWGIWLYQLSAE